MNDKPEAGKLYSLTGASNSIANGNTWAESEVKEYIVSVELSVSGSSVDEAINNFRNKVKNVEASVFEVVED